MDFATEKIRQLVQIFEHRRLKLFQPIVLAGEDIGTIYLAQDFSTLDRRLWTNLAIGVLVLLAITLAVQGGFLAFFLYLRKHAKRNAEIELDAEWVALQRPSRTS